MSQIPYTPAYGWQKSPIDPRNVVTEVSDVELAFSPAEVDPRTWAPEAENQLQLGACTANAYEGLAEMWRIVMGLPVFLGSRLFTYWQERDREGTTSTDSGAIGHDAFKNGVKVGSPRESFWPYDISRFAEQPSPAAYAQAAEGRIASYSHPTASESVFKALFARRQGVAFGFTVYSEFESEQVAATGIVPMPAVGAEEVGGHEVVACGYLAKYPEYVLVRNSWGPDWGLYGYFLMPWSYILSHALSGDWRTIDLVKP